MSDTNGAELASSLREQLGVMHGMMMSCARSNAKAFGCKEPTTTPRGLVLDKGFARFVTTNDLPKGIRRQKAGLCYQNAERIASRNPSRFIYCEGFAVRAQLVIVVGAHAWCLDRDNDFAVVDPTWRDLAPGAYLGLPVKLEFLYGIMVKTGYYGIMENLKLGCGFLDADESEWHEPVDREGDF